MNTLPLAIALLPIVLALLIGCIAVIATVELADVPDT